MSGSMDAENLHYWSSPGKSGTQGVARTGKTKTNFVSRRETCKKYIHRKGEEIGEDAQERGELKERGARATSREEPIDPVDK